MSYWHVLLHVSVSPTVSSEDLVEATDASGIGLDTVEGVHHQVQVKVPEKKSTCSVHIWISLH